MAVGKYSPTVTSAYMNNREWWKAVDDSGCFDKDGFDTYGYNSKDVDRAGNEENDYLVQCDYYEGENGNNNVFYSLYERVLSEWSFDKVTNQPISLENKQPKPKF